MYGELRAGERRAAQTKMNQLSLRTMAIQEVMDLRDRTFREEPRTTNDARKMNKMTEVQGRESRARA